MKMSESLSFLCNRLLFVSIVLTIHFLPICNALQIETEVGDETAFTYEKGTSTGPENWGKIDQQWRVCNNGRMQSPVDLLDGRVEIHPDLGELKRDYKPALASVKNRGHDIAVIWKGNAGVININGTAYKLTQCHWHSPSEHTFNGSRNKLELHAVHSSSDGKIAVVGITYKYGRPDRFLAKLIPHLNSLGHEEKDLGIINPGEIKFGSRKYYRYIGSLTVPPCTEGVVWTIVHKVLTKVRTVSRDQVRILRDAVQDGFESNARPTQDWDGRTVQFYTPREDCCLCSGS